MKTIIIPDAQRIKLNDPRIATELDRFITQMTYRQSRPDGFHRLNENSRFQLGTKLWVLAVKGMERHDPNKAPLLPFLKTILNQSANRLALAVLKKQLDREENEYGDISLDAPLSDAEEAEAIGSLIPENPEFVRLAGLRQYCDALLAKLNWYEQMALGTLMYDDRSKVAVADFLGISRPTLDILIAQASRKFATAANEMLYVRH